MAPSKNLLKLMAELYRLEELGFKGRVEINFDGSQAVDFVKTSRRMLDEMEIDDGALTELKVIALKISGA